ncbi:hypothetical protein A5658_07985 [Mycobacterium sp. 1245111.1]|uniref:nuclear transport factor 2 family protein n=1 Tax=Mycobacterium sp. 1245111.1 TaxID=1834073 RepID=UPI0007FBF975|nr:nuclear transport factor 2 family protein [Mycobacterium sp. 1245111.1]OBK35354.1 hypothetical protein A5658_07985 [Mycobacterium sp. 1245111.1]
MSAHRDEDLLARVRLLEDERDIARLVASYGPLADAADSDGVANLWTEDGTYDVDGWVMRGRNEIRAMVSSPQHHALVTDGCCHFLGPCAVTVTGDAATAVCESLVLRRRDERYVVFRASVNHIELNRTSGGWKIAARVTRTLTGNGDAADLVRKGIGQPAGD